MELANVRAYPLHYLNTVAIGMLFYINKHSILRWHPTYQISSIAERSLSRLSTAFSASLRVIVAFNALLNIPFSVL